MSTNERPGVYASYEVSGVSYSGAPKGTVGVAAISTGGTSGEVYDITSYAAAVSAFGTGTLTEMCRLLIKNGVRTIKAVPLASGASNSDYADAFELLAAIGEVRIIVCDSTAAAVHTQLKSAIEEADERAKHKIGIVEGTGTVSQIVNAAKAINSERIVMVSPAALDENGDAAAAGCLSAALAGAVISGADPAIPLNGAELYGLGGVSTNYTDGDITLLVQGGVTPVECVGGHMTVVRGITTRTMTGANPDKTYRELTTVMIIDDVIPTVRDALASGFTRTKNTERTRGAIRTRVIVELEKKLAAEIIDGYENVTVTQDDEDPTVCNVSFEFMVAHGLNQIRLTAFITV